MTWNLNIVMPEPFATAERALMFVSFDFLSPDCFVDRSDLPFASVYVHRLQYRHVGKIGQ